jgi:HTH-type transcriptional regulator, competence development regulator
MKSENESEGQKFGRRIRELRKAASLMQRELAERIGVDVTYISKMENDRLEHPPSLRIIQDLARVLEADELELMSLTDRVPTLIAPLVQNPAAVQFFRHAATAGTTAEEWEELLDHLKRQQSTRDDSERGT